MGPGRTSGGNLFSRCPASPVLMPSALRSESSTGMLHQVILRGMERGSSAVDREDRHGARDAAGRGRDGHRHRPLRLGPPPEPCPPAAAERGPFLAPTHRDWWSSGAPAARSWVRVLSLPHVQRFSEVAELLVATEMKPAEALRSRRAAGADERLAVDPEGVA